MSAAFSMHLMLASIAILTLFGIFLLILETFLPGWVAGILGSISILVAVALVLWAEEFAGWSSLARLMLAAGVLVFSSAILFGWMRWFAVKFFRRTLTLEASIASPAAHPHLTGVQGVAVTELRPLGRAEIGGRRYEVRTQGSMVPAGTPVEVIATEPGNLLVRPVAL